MAGAVCRLGVALHDLADPARLLGVSDEWILEPEDPWERVGHVPNVAFTCGAILEDDGTVKIYWGGADTEATTAFRNPPFGRATRPSPWSRPL